MRKPILRLMAISIVMLVLVAGMALAETTGGEVGTPAPYFDLVAQGGGSHTLEDYHGQVLVLFVIGYG